jgi:hypothetical protein
MVLAEGEHMIIAKNKDKQSRKDFTVVAAQNADVEAPADIIGAPTVKSAAIERRR